MGNFESNINNIRNNGTSGIVPNKHREGNKSSEQKIENKPSSSLDMQPSALAGRTLIVPSNNLKDKLLELANNEVKLIYELNSDLKSRFRVSDSEIVFNGKVYSKREDIFLSDDNDRIRKEDNYYIVEKNNDENQLTYIISNDAILHRLYDEENQHIGDVILFKTNHSEYRKGDVLVRYESNNREIIYRNGVLSRDKTEKSFKWGNSTEIKYNDETNNLSKKRLYMLKNNMTIVERTNKDGLVERTVNKQPVSEDGEFLSKNGEKYKLLFIDNQPVIMGFSEYMFIETQRILKERYPELSIPVNMHNAPSINTVLKNIKFPNFICSSTALMETSNNIKREIIISSSGFADRIKLNPKLFQGLLNIELAKKNKGYSQYSASKLVGAIQCIMSSDLCIENSDAVLKLYGKQSSKGEFYNHKDITGVVQKLETIIPKIKKNPEVFNLLMESDWDFDSIVDLMGVSDELNKVQDKLKRIVDLKHKDGSQKLNKYDVLNWLKINKTNEAYADKLLSLNFKNIKISNNKSYISMQLAYYNELVRRGVNPEEISLVLTRDSYVKGRYKVINYKDSNVTQTDFIHFDRDKDTNGTILKIDTEKVSGSDNLKRVRHEFSDGRYIVQEIHYKPSAVDSNYVEEQKTSYWNSDGIRERAVTINRSPDVEDLYMITEYNLSSEGKVNKKMISTVHRLDDNQGIEIVKDLKSPAGITSMHNMMFGPSMSRMIYTIKDFNDNLLVDTEREFRKLDDNHTISMLNGQRYDIQFNEDGVKVSKSNPNDNSIETILLGFDVLDKELLDLYKQLPGDFFFKIKEVGINRLFKDESLELQNNAAYNSMTHDLSISPELQNNPFVIMHELGHVLDRSFNISNDLEIRSIYKRELLNYKDVSSEVEGLSVDYFTNIKHSNKKNYLTEIVAETCALLSGCINNDFKEIQLRGIVLQQYFPETMAAIAKKIMR